MKSGSYGPQQLVATEGDIFWDLTPYTTYIAGYPLGTTIYVANRSTVDREYALIARLYDSSDQEILEEAITVFGYTWFPVEAGEYIELKAELQYDFSNAILEVSLREKSTDTDVNSVATFLVNPVNVPAGVVIPGVTTTTTTGFDWSSMMTMMMMVAMVAMVSNIGRKRDEQIEQPD